MTPNRYFSHDALLESDDDNADDAILAVETIELVPGKTRVICLNFILNGESACGTKYFNC